MVRVGAYLSRPPQSSRSLDYNGQRFGSLGPLALLGGNPRDTRVVHSSSSPNNMKLLTLWCVT